MNPSFKKKGSRRPCLGTLLWESSGVNQVLIRVQKYQRGVVMLLTIFRRLSGICVFDASNFSTPLTIFRPLRPIFHTMLGIIFNRRDYFFDIAATKFLTGATNVSIAAINYSTRPRLIFRPSRILFDHCD